MRKFVEDVFDFLFPRDIDSEGNPIKPELDDSYVEKVVYLILFLVVIIIAAITLR